MHQLNLAYVEGKCKVVLVHAIKAHGESEGVTDVTCAQYKHDTGIVNKRESQTTISNIHQVYALQTQYTNTKQSRDASQHLTNIHHISLIQTW